MGVGVAIGVATNLKLTGVVYLAPVLALIAARHGVRAFVTGGLLAAVVIALPFVIFPHLSLADYRFWLQMSSENGVRVRLLRPNIEWALYLAAPLGLSLFARPDVAQRWMLLTTCAAISLIIVLAAKPGAGPYHLLPFVPLIVWLAASFDAAAATPTALAWRSRAAAAFVLPAVIIIIAGIQQALFIDALRAAAHLHVARDITTFADEHPGARIEMGYGGTSSYKGSAPLTFYRPLLVFRDGDYLIDAPAVQEHQLAGIGIPPATLHALARCDVAYWLIPKNEEPFATRNMYAATGFTPLFSNEFRRTFADAYRVTTTTEYFDVYACRKNIQARIDWR
jgi:hypothetical protein